ncbi:MAG: hypothetical protein HRU10_09300 [Opitutales bacterium]|nr:hypothetical protein [Opitutales bacterium]
MPPVVAGVAALGSALGATAFTIGTLAVSWGTVLTVGASLGMSYLSARKAAKAAKAASIEGILETIRAPAKARELVYGTQRKGGVLIFAHVTGNDGRYLHLIIALAGHQVSAIKDVYFGDELAINSSGTVQSKYSGHVSFVKLLGSPDQAANSTMISNLSGLWTSADRLREIAALYLRLEWDDEVFNRIPNVTAILDGKICYDPFNQTSAFTKNPSLQLLDYHYDRNLGLGLDTDELYQSEIDAATLACNEDIPLDGIGTEKRYESSGVFTMEARPRSIIEKLIEAMAGTHNYTQGLHSWQSGVWNEPTITLSDDDLIQFPTLVTAIPYKDTFNGVKARISSEQSNYNIEDMPPLLSETFAAQDGDDEGSSISSGSLAVGSGYRIVSLDGDADFTGVGADENSVGLVFIATATSPTWGSGSLQLKRPRQSIIDIELPLTKSPTMAQRICKIILLESRQELLHKGVWRLNEKTYQALPGKNVRLNSTRFGFENKVFRVQQWGRVPLPGEKGGSGVGISLVLKETAEENFDWNTSEEQEVDPAPNTNLPDFRSVAAPTNVQLFSGNLFLYVKNDGTVVSRLYVTWTDPQDIYVTRGGHIEIQYRKTGAANWLSAGLVDGNVNEAYIWDVEDGEKYQVRLQSRTRINRSAWTGIVTHTISAKTNTSGVPAAPLFELTPLGFRLSWAFPDQSDIIRFNIYRYPLSPDLPGPDPVWGLYGSSLTNIIDIPFPPGDFSYWGVSTVNRSGVESAIINMGRNRSRGFQFPTTFDIAYPTDQPLTIGWATTFVSLFGAGPNYSFDLPIPTINEQMIISPDGGNSFHPPSATDGFWYPYPFNQNPTTQYEICWQYNPSEPSRPNSTSREPSPWKRYANDATGTGDLYMIIREVDETTPKNWNTEGHGPWRIENIQN